MTAFLFYLCVASSSAAQAQEALSLTVGQKTEGLSQALSYLEDPKHELSVELVLGGDVSMSRWQATTVNLGLSKSKHWLSLPIRNTSNQAGRWYLSTTALRFDLLKVYAHQNNETKLLHHSEFPNNISKRTVPNSQLYLPIELEANSSAVLVFEIYSNTLTQLAPRLLDENSLHTVISRAHLLDFCLIGLLLALACINIFHYLATKNKSYLYYSFLMCASALSIVQMMSYGLLFIWPDLAEFHRFFVIQSICLTLIFALVFAAEFLQLKDRKSRLYSFFKPLIFTLIALALLVPFIDFKLCLIAISCLVAASVSLLLASGVSAIRADIPAAKFYMVGWSIYGLGMLYLVATILGFNMFNVSGLEAVKVASGIEAIALSMALANRVAVLQRNEKLSQENLIRALRQQNDIQLELMEADAERFQAIHQVRTKSEKLMAASHDFSGPLQSIDASIESIKRSDNIEGAISNIESTLVYLRSLSGSLIQREQRESSPSDADLQAVFFQVFNRYANLAERKSLDFYFVGTSVRVSIDSIVITRILENLVSNAIRHTETGKVFFGVRRRLRGTEIHVIDTGPGFNIDVLEETESGSFRHTAEGLSSQGFGIGLRVVKTLCLNYGLVLQSRATSSGGSDVSVYLPHALHSA